MRTVLLACAGLLLLLASACSDDGEGSPDPSNGPTIAATSTPASSITPGERPTEVPTAASPVAETSILGEVVRRAEETPEAESLRTLLDASCANGILILETSIETIYGALPCDRFSEEQFGQLFEGRDVAIVLEASADRFRIRIETIDGAQAELTPDGIWVE